MQCNDSEKLELKTDTDFFPLKENSRWEYMSENFSTAEDNAFLGAGTEIIFIKGDTTIEAVVYKKVVNENGDLVKVLRKEGGRYYGRNHELYGGYSKEYLFLDEQAALNSSWTHIKVGYKTAYTVIGVNTTHTFNGVEYTNVMELQVDYYIQNEEDFKLSYSSLHFYAPGVGEIYTYYPYPSFSVYANVKISLLKYVP